MAVDANCTDVGCRYQVSRSPQLDLCGEYINRSFAFMVFPFTFATFLLTLVRGGSELWLWRSDDVHGEALPDFFSTRCDLCVLILCCVAFDALAPSRRAVCVAIAQIWSLLHRHLVGFLAGRFLALEGLERWYWELLMQGSVGLMADLRESNLGDGSEVY
ncbi:unnamed protein product [Calypogeia fissa]